MADEWDDFRTDQDAPDTYDTAPTTDDWAAFRAPQAPTATDDWAAFRTGAQQQDPQPRAESAFGSALRGAAHTVLPAIATVPGFIGGAALATPTGPIGSFFGGLAGGAAAYGAASKVQESALKTLGFDDSQQQAANAATHPYAQMIGEVVGAVPTFGVEAAAPLATRAIGAAIGGGFEAASQVGQGEGFDPGRLAIAAAGGALLTKPTAVAETLGGRTAAAIGRPDLWHGSAAPTAANDATAHPPPVDQAVGDPQNKPTRSETDYGKEAAAQPPAEQAITNTDPALEAAIRAKMEPGGEAAAPPPEQPTTPAGAAEPEIPTATSAKLEAQFPRVPPGVEERPLTGKPAAPVQPAQPPAAAQAAIANSKGFSVRWNPDEFQFEAVSKDGKVIGHLLDAMPEKGTPENPAFTAGAEVDEPWRRKGVASALYDAFAAKHDGNIAPAGNTSREAWDFWLKKYPDKTANYVKQQAADIAANARSGNFDPEAFTDQSIRNNYDHPKIQDMIIKELRSAAPATPREAIEQRAPGETVGEAMRRQVLERGRSGRPIETEPLPIGTEPAILEKGLERATGPQPAPEVEPPPKGPISEEHLARAASPYTEQDPYSGMGSKYFYTRVRPGPDGKPEFRLMGGGDIISAYPSAKQANAALRAARAQYKQAAAAKTAAAGVAGAPPPKPPTVGQAAAAGGGKLPPGPTSMAYAPPQNRSNLSKLWRSMKLLVGSDIGPYGRQAENIIRGAYGRAKRVFEQTMNLLNPHMETVRNMGPMDRAALMNRVEGGKDFPNWQPTPDQQRLIDVYKPAMDLWKDQFSKLDRTAQMKFVSDYLAHMYKNPAQASEFFSQFGKRGGAGSTKGRTHATYEDAKKAGLEPLTDNPIEIATRYGLSMTNFLASNDALERAVETGVVGYFNSGKSVGATGSPEPHQVGGPPPGWKKLNAPPKGPFLEAYAPEDFADKYNAFYSQGLRGVHAPIYDALRSANAGWTMMELGLNAYHFFTMANEAIISDVKRGLDQIFTGQFKEGAKTIAGAPLAPGTRYIEGKRFQQEYLDPNSTNPIASIMAEANARPVGRGHAYDILGSAGDENISRGSFIKNFDKDKINSQLKQAWDDVKDDWGLADSVGKQAMFPFKQASRVLQTVGAPLFDKYIPALKAGAMHSQMADWLAKNPHIDINTPAGRQAAVEMAMKISDGVDNAFGEMVHDNLFMNQALRHAAMVAMRSFSWSIGAMRQIGGGTYAAGKAAALSLKTGENRFSMAHPEFDPRISYAIAFPFVVATISAIYQGLRAGEAPQDWRDLYAPRTGGTVPGLGGKGQVPEHALMPGFQKDVYGWLTHPGREVYAKLGGLPTTAYEQITNRDWRGDPIAQRGASPIDQFQQRMAHLFSKLGPIGARAIAKGQPETSGITPVETALGFRAPGVDIQDPQRLEKWMAASAKKEWKAKERHDKTEQRKYARERTYDPREREQQPQ